MYEIRGKNIFGKNIYVQVFLCGLVSLSVSARIRAQLRGDIAKRFRALLCLLPVRYPDDGKAIGITSATTVSVSTV